MGLSIFSLMAAFLVVRYGVQIGFTLPLADSESDATEHLALSLDQALCTATVCQ